MALEPRTNLLRFLNSVIHKVLGAAENVRGLGIGVPSKPELTSDLTIFPNTAIEQASSTTRDALGGIFALDRRHDNPDRDGE